MALVVLMKSVLNSLFIYTFFLLDRKKIYVIPPTIHGGLLHHPHPQTIKPDILRPELSKTGQITP